MSSRVCILASVSFLVVSTLEAADWPQWRGVNRDGLVAGEKSLDGLPSSPESAWKVSVGKGQGGLVLVSGKLVLLHEVTRGGKKMEAAALINASNGKTLWETPFAESWQYTNVYGPGPRCSPMIDGDLVFVQGVIGVLACIHIKSGKLLWSANYEEDFGTKWFGGNKPGSRGTAASRHGNNGPPVTDEKHIFAPVGSPKGASLVAFEKRTGKVAWKSGTDFAAYAGLMHGELAGVKQLVMVTAGNMIGYRAGDGKQLWSVPVKTGAARNIITPILHGDTVTVASHTVGTFQVRIRNTGEVQKAEEVWRNMEVKTNITTPVLIDGHLYGIGTGSRSTSFVCIEHTTGKMKWSQPGFPDYVSVIGLNGQLLAHTSQGELMLLKASPEKYTEIGRTQVCGRTWHFPVYSDGILFVKDGRQLAAVNLK